jgi:tetratricopeptide (TPR) repeat protein
MRAGRLPVLALVIAAAAWRAAGQANLPSPPTNLGLLDFPAEVRGQLQGALDVLQAHPQDAQANGKMGMFLDVYKRPNAAAIYYQRAHLLDPGSFRWLYYWGSLRAAQGQHQEAVQILYKALAKKPTYLPARLKLAESLLAIGQWKEGEDTYRALVRNHPDLAGAHFGLGRVYSTRGDMKAAVESYLKACELFPAYGPAHYALALAYRKLGQSDEAQRHLKIYSENKALVPPIDDPLRDALQELDLGAVSHLRRGLALEQAGRLEDSIAEHERALQLDPKLVLAHVNLIALYGRTGKFEKAEEHYRAAVSLNPGQFASAHYYSGVLQFGQGKYPEAEKAFRQALDVNPYYAEAHHNLGVTLELRGQLAEAAHEYGKALETQPDYRLAHFHLARILVNERKFDEAIQHFLKTLTPADESTPTYLYALAATYARAGDRATALTYYRRAQQEATTRGQAQLLKSIERDLRLLEEK